MPRRLELRDRQYIFFVPHPPSFSRISRFQPATVLDLGGVGEPMRVATLAVQRDIFMRAGVCKRIVRFIKRTRDLRELLVCHILVMNYPSGAGSKNNFLGKRGISSIGTQCD